MKNKLIQLGAVGAMLIGALWAGNTHAQSTIPGPGDAVYLHYDVAPDPDDLHAILAGSQLSQRVGLLPNVITVSYTHLTLPTICSV